MGRWAKQQRLETLTKAYLVGGARVTITPIPRQRDSVMLDIDGDARPYDVAVLSHATGLAAAGVRAAWTEIARHLPTILAVEVLDRG